ncbi:MAG: membrane dipeptidase [Planctomycetaceae bacterium]|nr:membrane dipeptidase [Planctomycetaceae bacterium]
MLLFDAHLDLALNGVDWNRDMRKAVDDLRAQEQALNMTEHGRRGSTLSLPELRHAEVGLCLSTLLARQEKEINHSFGWTSPQTCYAMAYAHLAWHRAMERDGWLKMLRTKKDLQDHVEAWEENPQSTPLGFILTMEGADPVLTPDTIDEFHSVGLRAIGLTHYGANRYGGGTNCEVGIAFDAVPLLKNIERLGMTVDVTHLSDVAFWQVLDHFGGRIHASHQNSRRICDWQRQFSDEQYLAVIKRDGVIGMALDAIMLQPGYVRDVTTPTVLLERVVDNIDIVCQLSGSVKHVGIGSDLDGGYGVEQTPADFDRISDLQRLPDMLSHRNYSDVDIADIMHGNWIRFFSQVLPD